MYKLLLSSLLLFSSSFIYADILVTKSKFSNKNVEVIIKESKDFKDKVDGIQFFIVTKVGNVGTSFFQRVSFYHIDENTILEEEDIYRITGFLSEKVAEIHEQYYSKYWAVDNQIIKKFDELLASYVKGALTNEKQIEIYKQLVNSYPFHGKKFRKEKRGKNYSKWVLGKQMINDLPINLLKSQEYGNIFTSSFIRN